MGSSNGCLHGCMAGVLKKEVAPAERDGAELQAKVQEIVSQRVKTLEESLSSELTSTLDRLLKLNQQGAAPSHFADDMELTTHTRAEVKRRWTVAVDGNVNDSVNSLLMRTASGGYDDKEEEFGRVLTDVSQVSDDGGGSHSFAGLSSRGSASISMSAGDTSTKNAGDGTPKRDSSVVWRVDALDFGDKLASTAAAKKGSASVDSIVDLVETERERWADEKRILEEKVEELKKEQQMRRRGFDPEKESLKQEVVNLRATMKLRSRFGAWVCEKHMQESDDEEDGEDEKEELRDQLASLQHDLKIAQRRKLAAAASSSA